MDEQRIELKKLELMLSQFGVRPDHLYPPMEMAAFEVHSSTTATSTYTNRDFHMFNGEGYEQAVGFDTSSSSWTNSPSAAFMPPQVMSSSHFFPDSYSNLVTSNYCCSDDPVQDQGLVTTENFDGKGDESSSAR